MRFFYSLFGNILATNLPFLKPKNFPAYLITWRWGGVCRMVFLWRLGLLILYITSCAQGWDQSKFIVNHYHHWSNRVFSDAFNGGVCLGVLEFWGGLSCQLFILDQSSFLLIYFEIELLKDVVPLSYTPGVGHGTYVTSLLFLT